MASSTNASSNSLLCWYENPFTSQNQQHNISQTQIRIEHFNTHQGFQEKLTELGVNKKHLIGKGTFGTVYSIGNRVLKLQEINVDTQKERRFYLAFQGRVRHLPKCYEIYSSETHMALVLEDVGANIHTERIKRNERNQIITIQELQESALRWAECLSDMHQMGYAHFDVKPQNMSFTHLFDLSLSEEVPEEGACYESFKTSRWYRAPEVIFESYVGTKVDSYSLGASLFELYTNDVCTRLELIEDSDEYDDRNWINWLYVFRHALDQNTFHISKKIRRRIGYNCPKSKCWLPDRASSGLKVPISYIARLEYAFRKRGDPPELFSQFKDLISGLLNPSQEHRLSCTEALEHPFFQSIRFSQDDEKIDTTVTSMEEMNLNEEKKAS